MTIWVSPSVWMPVTGMRVACALGDTIASGVSMMALRSDDLPTFGRPARAMAPKRVVMGGRIVWRWGLRGGTR